MYIFVYYNNALIFCMLIIGEDQSRTSSSILVLSILSLLGAICGFLLPETMNANLPQTIDEGENFRKDQTLYNRVPVLYLIVL
jgi:hypothetical protein